MESTLKAKYEIWMEKAVADPDLKPELEAMAGDEAKIEDAFYKDLEFGTAGLRGVIGAGTNRMNVYIVARASQGLSNYVINHFPAEKRSIAISYDSRIKSDVFAKIAAEVFAANGIKAYIFKELMPVPCVSYATRTLHCAAGIMVTASHNPSNGSIAWIPDEVYTAFVEEVKKQSVVGDAEINKDVAIVYSPLNGAGLKPVLRTLKETGYTNITVVKEQEQPDGNFPTCPYPNPEIHEAMALGMEYAAKYNADLLLATDPDSDRVGIAVKDKEGNYQLLTGNQTGMLLTDYVCARRTENGTMPKDPVVIKTIVTSDMVEQIASHYGVRTVNVLTGFKYIGEQIGLLEKQGKADSYIFGFEESYGYLSGSYVRDKDAVDAAFLICEMFCYYKTRGISLLDKLDELYKRHGYCLNTLYSYQFEGAAGFVKMKEIMKDFQTAGITEFGGRKVETLLDYNTGIDGLPKENVLKFLLEGHGSVVVRPSGTEPKLKTYVTVSAPDKAAAEVIEKKIVEDLKKRING